MNTDHTAVITWDELPTAHRAAVEQVERLCQVIKNNIQPSRVTPDPPTTHPVGNVGGGTQVSLRDIPITYSLAEIIQFLFPPNVLSNTDASLRRAFISSSIAEVYFFNDYILDQLPSNKSASLIASTLPC